jgi:hypothetical protein
MDTSLITMNLTRTMNIAYVVQAAERNATVRRLVDGEVVTGMARSISTQSGRMPVDNDDVRELYLHVVVGLLGSEQLWKLTELADQHDVGEFAWND